MQINGRGFSYSNSTLTKRVIFQKSLYLGVYAIKLKKKQKSVIITMTWTKFAKEMLS